MYNFFIKKIKQPDLDIVIDTLGCDYIKTYRGDEILNFMKKKAMIFFFQRMFTLKTNVQSEQLLNQGF